MDIRGALLLLDLRLTWQLPGLQLIHCGDAGIQLDHYCLVNLFALKVTSLEQQHALPWYKSIIHTQAYEQVVASSSTAMPQQYSSTMLYMTAALHSPLSLCLPHWRLTAWLCRSWRVWSRCLHGGEQAIIAAGGAEQQK